MKMHGLKCLVPVMLSVGTVPVAGAQAPSQEYPVRVTVRDSLGDQRVFGRLVAARSDSVIIRIADSDSLHSISRTAIVRIERRGHISVGNLMLGGCLVAGGILGISGSQLHDPDSPGIEKFAATVGFVIGCGIGALGGAVIGFLNRHYGWETLSV